MSTARWRHLDRRKPEPCPIPEAESTPAGVPPQVADSRSGPARRTPEAEHPALRQARAYYQLRRFEATAELLRAVLAQKGEVAGLHRLLGLALGRLDDPDAVPTLAFAYAADPEDAELLASLRSAQIRAGAIPDPPAPAVSGAAAEFDAAAHWLRGQERLRGGSPDAAAACFGAAADLFTRASPPGALGERVAACYVGLALGYLLAGRLDAAQAAFSKLVGRAAVPPPALRFARQLYDVADAVREVPPAERPGVLAPLAPLTAGARLYVRFYDATAPASIHWDLWTPPA